MNRRLFLGVLAQLIGSLTVLKKSIAMNIGDWDEYDQYSNGYNPYNPYGYNPYNPYGYNPYNPYGYNPYNPYGYNPYNPYGYNPYNPYGGRRGGWLDPYCEATDPMDPYWDPYCDYDQNGPYGPGWDLDVKNLKLPLESQKIKSAARLFETLTNLNKKS